MSKQFKFKNIEQKIFLLKTQGIEDPMHLLDELIKHGDVPEEGFDETDKVKLAFFHEKHSGICITSAYSTTINPVTLSVLSKFKRKVEQTDDMLKKRVKTQ